MEKSWCARAHYSEAARICSQTVHIAPNSDKAVLLYAKASLLSGDPGSADDAMRAHNGGRFEDTPEYPGSKSNIRTGRQRGQGNQQAIELAAQPVRSRKRPA